MIMFYYLPILSGKNLSKVSSKIALFEVTVRARSGLDFVLSAWRMQKSERIGTRKTTKFLSKTFLPIPNL